MIARELNAEFVEWVNGVNENAFEQSGAHSGDHGDFLATVTALDADDRRQYTPAMERFAKFLKQADKYPALDFGGALMNSENTIQNHDQPPRKIIVIEDLPPLSTSALRQEFQRLVRAYLDSPRTAYPLVFIVSDFSDDFSIDNSDASFLTQRVTGDRRGGEGDNSSGALHLYSIFSPGLLQHSFVQKIT